MAARDGAASIQGEVVRITPLNLDGSIDTTKPILTTSGFISAQLRHRVRRRRRDHREGRERRNLHPVQGRRLDEGHHLQPVVVYA